MRATKPDLGPLTDEEDARITAAAEADPDTWILTEEDFAQMRPFAEVHPELAAFIRRHGVMISTQTLANIEAPRDQVTVNLDKGLATFFKQHRDGGEDLLNHILRSVVFDEELVITRCKEGVIYCRCDDDPKDSTEENSQPEPNPEQADLVKA